MQTKTNFTQFHNPHNRIARLFNVQSLLWLALALAMAGSLRHLAFIFASMDHDTFSGWIQAIAIDAGLFALSYSLRIRKGQKRGVKIIWLGIVLFTSISIYGNLAYGYIATTDNLPFWITVSRPYILAASLPILVLYLAELVADNREYAGKMDKLAAKKLAKKDNALKAKKDNSRGQNGGISPLNGQSIDHANEAIQDKIVLRRKQLLTLKEQGLTQKEIADKLGVSIGTVKNDLRQVNGRMTK